MEKIINLFNLINVKGEFGLEHEVEGENLLRVEDDIWDTKSDGSLRGIYPYSAAEFVLVKPLSLNDAVDAVKRLDKILSNNGAKYKFSYRTSTHVHFNVLQFTEDQLYNLCMVYYLLEPAIINLCGEGRVNNRFCLRMIDADEISELFRNLIVKGWKVVLDYPEGNIKYSALNFASIRRYGSIEFRSMQGTLDSELVKAWLTLISRMATYAKKHKTLVDVYNAAVTGGYRKFVTDAIGDMIDYLPKDSEKNFNYAISITMDFPQLYKHYHKEKKDA